MKITRRFVYDEVADFASCEVKKVKYRIVKRYVKDFGDQKKVVLLVKKGTHYGVLKFDQYSSEEDLRAEKWFDNFVHANLLYSSQLGLPVASVCIGSLSIA